MPIRSKFKLIASKVFNGEKTKSQKKSAPHNASQSIRHPESRSALRAVQVTPTKNLPTTIHLPPKNIRHSSIQQKTVAPNTASRYETSKTSTTAASSNDSKAAVKPKITVEPSIKNVEGFSIASTGDKVFLNKMLAGKGIEKASEMALPVLYDTEKDSLYVYSQKGEKLTIPHTISELGGKPLTDENGNPVVVLDDRFGTEYYFAIDKETQTLQPFKVPLKLIPQNNFKIIKNKDGTAYTAYKEKIDIATLINEKITGTLQERVFVQGDKAMIKVPTTSGNPPFVYRSLNEFSNDMHELNAAAMLTPISDDTAKISSEDIQTRNKLTAHITEMSEMYEGVVDDSFGMLDETENYQKIKQYHPENFNRIKTKADFESIHNQLNIDFSTLEKSLQLEWQAVKHNGVIDKSKLEEIVLNNKKNVLISTLNQMMTNFFEREENTDDDSYDRQKPVLEAVLSRRQAVYKEISSSVKILVTQGIMTEQEGNTFLQDTVLKKLQMSAARYLTSNMFLFNQDDGILNDNDKTPWTGNIDDLIWTMAAGIVSQNTPQIKPPAAEPTSPVTQSRIKEFLQDKVTTAAQLLSTSKDSPLKDWDSAKKEILGRMQTMVDKAFDRMAIQGDDTDKVFKASAQEFITRNINAIFSNFEKEERISSSFSKENIQKLVIKKAESLKIEEGQSRNPLCYVENVTANKITLNKSTVIRKSSSEEILSKQDFFEQTISLNAPRPFFTRVIDWFAGRSAEQSALLKMVNNLPSRALTEEQKINVENFIKNNQPLSLVMHAGKLDGLKTENISSNLDSSDLQNQSLKAFFKAVNDTNKEAKQLSFSEIQIRVKAAAQAYSEMTGNFEKSRLLAMKTLMNNLSMLDPMTEYGDFSAQKQSENPVIKKEFITQIGPLFSADDDFYKVEKSLLIDTLRQGFYHAREQEIPDNLVALFFGSVTAKTKSDTQLLISKPWLGTKNFMLPIK